jgi:hypothetical protein
MRIGRNTLAGTLFLASVGLALIPAGGAVAGPAAASVPAAAAENGTLGCTQLEALWEEAGGSPAAAFTAAEVAMAESSGRENATNVNSNGSTDEGYWQINNQAHPGQATYDPLGNARAAVAISGNGTNWTPWVTYQHGAENGQCR